MRSLTWLLMAGLIVSGCVTRAPEVTPTPVDVVSVPHAPPVVIADATPLSGMPSRPPGRDPFARPIHPVTPPAATPRPSHEQHTASIPSHAGHSTGPAIEQAPLHVDYTVAGIFRSPRGDIALLNGKNGCIVATPGVRLDEHVSVRTIDMQHEQVTLSYGSHVYVLPLHADGTAPHTLSGAVGVGETRHSSTNPG